MTRPYPIPIQTQSADRMQTLAQTQRQIAPSIDSFQPFTDQQRQQSIAQTLDQCQWRPHQDLWVYGYGSLIWRPEFDFIEKRPGILRGHHRALCLWSRVNRGTPDNPGLVFGLDRGGSCRGMAYRLPAINIPHTFEKLWAREMSTGAYVPKWLRCSTPKGDVSVLAFVVNREAVSYVPKMGTSQTLEIIRQAQGRYGSCLEYVLQTHQALEASGIRDKRLAALADLIGNHAHGTAAAS